jgi:hypothetical protein
VGDIAPSPDQGPSDLFQRWGLSGRVLLEQKRDQLLQGCAEIPEDQHPAAIERFLSDRGLTSASAVQSWLRLDGLSQADLLSQALRHEQWLAWCERECAGQLASYFLKRKSELDQVCYTILPLPEEELSLELYLQIKEGEKDFDRILAETTPHPELGERGRFGPISLSDLPEGLAQLLRVSRPGQLWPPKPIAQGWALVRLDASQPAVLNQALRRSLLLELGHRLLASPLPKD